MSRDGARVGVVLTVHDDDRYIAEAVDSVLAQTYRPAEVVVVNDGTASGPRRALERFGSRIRLVSTADRGPAEARNAGIRESTTPFLGFLDHDDVWLPDKLQRQMGAFERSPETEVVFAHVTEFLSPDLDPTKAKSYRVAARDAPAPLLGTMLIRREAFGRVGFFTPGWAVSEWIDWYARAQEHDLRTVMLPKVLLRRRLHSSNRTLREGDHLVEYAAVLKEALDRRRAAPGARKQGEG